MKDRTKKQRERERIQRQVQEIAQRYHMESLSAEELVALIADEEPGVDWAAQSVLEARGSQSLDALVAGLTHAAKKVRGTCALILDHLADDRCVTPLLQTMRHDRLESVRRCAMHALSCEGCKATPLEVDAVGALIEAALTDRSKQVRQRAVFYLSGHHDDARVVPAIGKLLETETDPVTRCRAQRLLRGFVQDNSEDNSERRAFHDLSQDREGQSAYQILDNPASAAFWDRLEQTNPLPMMAAAQLLSPVAISALRLPLQNGHGHSGWRVRRTCAALLISVGDTGSVEPPCIALEDPKEDVRRMALEALLSLGRKHAFPEAALVNILTKLALTDRSRIVRRIAIAALGERMPHEPIATALSQVCKNEQSPALVAHAQNALRKRAYA